MIKISVGAYFVRGIALLFLPKRAGKKDKVRRKRRTS